MKEAFDNMVHRVYIHGRKWMVEKVISVKFSSLVTKFSYFINFYHNSE